MSWIFVTFHRILSVVGCVLNAMICHVAAWKSPTVIKTYSIITVNVAITKLAICVVNFVLQMRMIPMQKTMIFVSYGPCQWLNNKICFDLYSILVHGYTHTIWLLLLSFCYRYYVMVKALILFVIYLPSFLQMILLFFDFTDPSTLLKIQQSLVPQYILKKMEFKGVDLKSNTRNLQLQLLRVLTFQAIIPCFYLIGVISYFVCRLEFIRIHFSSISFSPHSFLFQYFLQYLHSYLLQHSTGNGF
ncbi:Protein CBR-SRD-5 [Caenorhabditis briggsae]|uniref:Protein CBR-SRD-5 n=1 Tax=Caenorhabditis briggsae TaxID=6238 RepID=A8XWN2_CAEBR|nr:Protein CBR-SRD-5 [Caenorhabditis briggsae]CAP37051.2 Protein CBR-SRD-5 [Caenorhabditis briggsae]